MAPSLAGRAGPCLAPDRSLAIRLAPRDPSWSWLATLSTALQAVFLHVTHMASSRYGPGTHCHGPEASGVPRAKNCCRDDAEQLAVEPLRKSQRLLHTSSTAVLRFLDSCRLRAEPQVLRDQLISTAHATLQPQSCATAYQGGHNVPSCIRPLPWSSVLPALDQAPQPLNICRVSSSAHGIIPTWSNYYFLCYCYCLLFCLPFLLVWPGSQKKTRTFYAKAQFEENARLLYAKAQRETSRLANQRSNEVNGQEAEVQGARKPDEPESQQARQPEKPKSRNIKKLKNAKKPRNQEKPQSQDIHEPRCQEAQHYEANKPEQKAHKEPQGTGTTKSKSYGDFSTR